MQFIALGFTVILCGALSGQEKVLFGDDFEHGLGPQWEGRSGQWTVVADPDNPQNHVLLLDTQQGGTIRAGDPGWRNVRVSARVRIQTQARDYHVKLGCRADETQSYFINLRKQSPIVVHRSGADFRALGEVGPLPLKPGAWYRAEIEAAGPFLTARAWREEQPDKRVSARFYEPSLDHGQIHLTVFLYDGPAKVYFDDIRVVEVPATQISAPGPDHIIRNDTIKLTFHEGLGTFDLQDLRTNRTWRQAIGASLTTVSDVVTEAGGIRFKLQTSAGPAKATLQLQGEGEVLVTLEPDGQGRYASVIYPQPIEPPVKEAELVLPADEGIILPVTDVERRRIIGAYHYGQGGWLMPWCGMVVGDEGLMMLVETADDFRGRVQLLRTDVGPLMTPCVEWLASMEDLRYPRRLRYCLFDRGGYVAMAKRYRRYLQDRGRFRTVAEKAKELPQVSGLIGAINILDQSRGEEVLDWMIDHGIRHALYSCSGPKARIEKAKAQGYVVNRYDIYTDVAGPELLKIWGPPRSKDDYRRIGYPEECFIRRDGTPLPGFAYPVGAKAGVAPEGAKGKRVRCFKRCSAMQLHWMQQVIPGQIEQFGYNARFIDVETAHSLYECYSDQHRATRTQDRENRLKLFDYLRSLGQVCSSEGGADWAASALHYQEGSLTLTRLGWIPGVYVGTGPFKLPEEYIKNQFDPAIRVPLHKLVYHDSLFMTWRWNHTPNRWDQQQYWDDWDLLHTLYGGMPIFVVNKQQIANKGPRILQSYHTICDFTEKVGGHEMTTHRFVTPDRLVQETRFATGLGIIVNFGDAPYQSEQGEVKAKGFVTFEFH